MADARCEEAVARLRARKRREEKPFAVLSATLAAVRRYAHVNAHEARLLSGPRCPIVLVRRRRDGAADPLAEGVAPGNRAYGAMLAYTPVHHLLCDGGCDTLVATSGNVSEEPIAYRDDDALARLAGIADAWLVGEREIHTRVDDSIVRVVVHAPPVVPPTAGGERGGSAPAASSKHSTETETGVLVRSSKRVQAEAGTHVETTVLRRARGYAPEPVRAPFAAPPLVAVGPQLKNTVCVTRGRELCLSHHLGDLDNAPTVRAWAHTVAHLTRLWEVTPETIAHDAHPGYASTRWALAQDRLPTVAVQHHHAHVAACMCEHGLTEPVVGVVFDGTGYGTDGHVWGGEWLVGDYAGVERAAHLAYFRLPGGDRAVREPYRVALALLWEAYGEEWPALDVPVVRARAPHEVHALTRMLATGTRAPRCSSVGRLFDGVAALAGVRERCRYEAQAALELEQLVEPRVTETLGASARQGTPGARGRLRAQDGPWPWRLDATGPWPWQVDLRPAVREVVREVTRGEGAAHVSARLHRTVVDVVASTCAAIRARTGLERVVLSGGVFQNEVLLRGCRRALTEAGWQVHTHRRVPPNDGGVALGQAAVAGWGAAR